MLSPEGLEVSFDEPAEQRKGTKGTSHSADHGKDYMTGHFRR
jgi:hypothetical protein